MSRNAGKNEPTFEQALTRLESIVESIEQGKVSLEESITQYEEGMKLIHRCRSILTDAEQKIQKLQLSAEGELKAEPFDAEAAEDEADIE
ncbi:MAG: exodeoxyribonuclease VII small subunit [Phycisphaerae bacterium]|nr:exodeoxyribonuclease VII small subunit [Phycisphaerae bacterium]